jgi:predicted RecB family endonuclease
MAHLETAAFILIVIALGIHFLREKQTEGLRGIKGLIKSTKNIAENEIDAAKHLVEGMSITSTLKKKGEKLVHEAEHLVEGMYGAAATPKCALSAQTLQNK